MFWLIEVFRKWGLWTLNVLIVFFISVFPAGATSIISIYEHGHHSYSSVDLKIGEETSLLTAQNLETEMAPGQFSGVGYANFTSTARNAAKGETSVLGKYPDYINLAEQLGTKRFNVPTNIWNKISAAEQWGANQKFLDRMIMRGDKIILSNPVLDVNKVSGAFRQELDYLIRKGYRLNSTGTQLIR